MAKKWVLGLAAAMTIVAVAGVGFSAFTATAYVNGTATAATVGLTVAPDANFPMSCSWMDTGAPDANASITITEVSSTQVNIVASGLVPGVACNGVIWVNNTGSVALNLTNTLTPGAGICAPSASDNCIDVTGVYTIDPLYGVYSYNNPILTPGSYQDPYTVYIPDGFTMAPASASFTFTYVGTAGV